MTKAMSFLCGLCLGLAVMAGRTLLPHPIPQRAVTYPVNQLAGDHWLIVGTVTGVEYVPGWSAWVLSLHGEQLVTVQCKVSDPTAAQIPVGSIVIVDGQNGGSVVNGQPTAFIKCKVVSVHGDMTE